MRIQLYILNMEEGNNGVKKVLRSMIHEVFPFDLRVEIDLLSRRRDISNAEKQEELFKLLRKYNIDNITPLGSGTNRYAFKINGFVVKIATDHDGKIDNLKEFKMAKRLYPHVIKVYEVAENGTMLVCEYIQPFQSYGEMMKYEDEIKKILSDLSSVYLIGDVGITRKNYTNWGLRVGDDKPVCLDFAYVYEVNSDLFLCGYCKSNSMLLPSSDFTKLYCPHPGCGREYTFEDIRTRLGNDVHRHEIGDLGEEGYALTESNVETELTFEQSNYLAKKKVNKVETAKPVEEETPDNFFIPENNMYTTENKNSLEEDMTMTGIFKNAQVVIPTPGVKIIAKTPDKVYVGPAKSDVAAISEETKAEVVMEAKVEKGTTDIFDVTTPDISDSNDIPDTTTKIPEGPEDGVVFSVDVPKSTEVTYIPRPPRPEKKADKAAKPVEKAKPAVENKSKPEVKPAEVSKANTQANPEKVAKPAKKQSPITIKNDWLKLTAATLDLALTKTVSKIHLWLMENKMYDLCREFMRRPGEMKEWYKTVQSGIFFGLANYLQYERTVNTDDEGNRKILYVCTEIEDQEFTPTLRFIARFWGNKAVYNQEGGTESLRAYREKYADFLGIQEEAKYFVRKSLLKILRDTSSEGINLLVDTLFDTWGIPVENSDDSPVDPSPDKPDSTAAVEETKAEEVAEIINEINSSNKTEDDSEEDEEEELDDEFEEDDEEDDFRVYVKINRDESGRDTIKLYTADSYGPVIIPFYDKIDGYNPNRDPNNQIDDRNGAFEWLAYTQPDKMFYTSDPEKWLKYNDVTIPEAPKFVIIDSDDDETSYLMGIYFIGGIDVIDAMGISHSCMNDDMLSILNQIIGDDLSAISNYRVVALTSDEVLSEEFLEECLREGEEDSNEDEEDFDEDEEETTDQETEEVEDDAEDTEGEKPLDMAEASAAAFEALMGVSASTEESTDDSNEETEDGGDIIVEDREEESKEEETPEVEFDEDDERMERMRRKEADRQRRKQRDKRQEPEMMNFRPIYRNR